MLDFDVCVIGSLNMDLVVRAARIPHPGETLLGSAFARCPGGKGSNQAIAAALAGARTRLIGALGDDEHGRELRRALADHSVDDQCVGKVDAPTGVALITVADNGENAIVVAPGANSRVSVELVESCAPRIRSARICVAQLEIPLAAVRRGLEIARAAGATTVLNAAPFHERARDLLPWTDVLVVNAGEARALARAPHEVDAALARELWRDSGLRCVLVTLGSRGAVLADESGVEHLPAFRVEVVDTTGCGDAFVGAFAAAFARQVPMRRAALEGCAAGALAATRLGALAALPTRVEIERLLATAPA
ncbi:MAG: ribokinase [Planctomycetes bacterium]|nr:ribokinase [Planctomycetota bacterium]